MSYEIRPILAELRAVPCCISVHTDDLYCGACLCSVTTPAVSVRRIEDRVAVLRVLAQLVLTAKNTPPTPAPAASSSRPVMLLPGTIVRRGPDWKCVPASPCVPMCGTAVIVVLAGVTWQVGQFRWRRGQRWHSAIYEVL